MKVFLSNSIFFCKDKVYLPIVNKNIQALFSIERKLLHKHIRNMISKQMEKVTANVGKRKCDKIYSTNLIKTMVFCYQNCSDLLWQKIVLVIEKTFEIRGWRPRICKIFEITRTIYSNSERPEQFLVTECFFNLFLEVSHI